MNDFVPFLNERTNFTKNIEKKSTIFYGTSGFFQTHFLKRTILLNERLFSEKANEINYFLNDIKN